MAYNKHTWVDKELITPEKLNNIENGIAEISQAANNVYSTTGTRIGTWINGKPLYRKILAGTAPSSTSTTIWENALSQNNECVAMYGTIRYKEGGVDFMNSFGNGASFIIDNSNGMIGISISNQGYANQPFTAILEYT